MAVEQLIVETDINLGLELINQTTFFPFRCW